MIDEGENQGQGSQNTQQAQTDQQQTPPPPPPLNEPRGNTNTFNDNKGLGQDTKGHEKK